MCAHLLYGSQVRLRFFDRLQRSFQFVDPSYLNRALAGKCKSAAAKLIRKVEREPRDGKAARRRGIDGERRRRSRK